jgi:hypothetical protein
MSRKLGSVLVLALTFPSVASGADEEAKNRARAEWAESLLSDFWDAAFAVDVPSADALLSPALVDAWRAEARGRPGSYAAYLVQRYKLFPGSPQYKGTSRAMDPDGTEVTLAGELTNGDWKADVKARVARDVPGGKWSIRYLLVKQREAPADKKGK